MTTFTYPQVQFLIDGVWRRGARGLSLPVLDPATDETLGEIPRATREDLDAALAAAEREFARLAQDFRVRPLEADAPRRRYLARARRSIAWIDDQRTGQTARAGESGS